MDCLGEGFRSSRPTNRLLIAECCLVMVLALAVFDERRGTAKALTKVGEGSNLLPSVVPCEPLGWQTLYEQRRDRDRSSVSGGFSRGW